MLVNRVFLREEIVLRVFLDLQFFYSKIPF